MLHIWETQMVDPNIKTTTIQSMREPWNASEVKSFLVFNVYYRHYIPDVARIAEPLVSLTRKTSIVRSSERKKTRLPSGWRCSICVWVAIITRGEHRVAEDFKIASMLENLLVCVLGLTALKCTRNRKIRYDNTPYLKSYEPGEQVQLRVLQKAHKFGNIWEGPFSETFSNGNYHLSNYAHNPIHGDCLISYSHCNDLVPDVGIQLSIAAGANPQELYKISFHFSYFSNYVMFKGRIESLLRRSSTSRSPVISNRS